jgi:hypothetical protein
MDLTKEDRQEDNTPPGKRLRILPKDESWYRKHGKQPKDPTQYVPRYNGTQYYEDEHR